mgnify:CR=1 FL=1
MSGYYDYVLGLIPVALFGVTAVLSLVGVPTTAALPVGASVALGLMCHAMFVRAPLTDTEPGSGGTTAGHASRDAVATGGSD